MIYLASPYSHEDPAVEAARFDAVCKVTGLLLLQEYCVVSPIAHSHPIYERVPETGGAWEAWVELDHALIDASEQVWVLMLDGWDRSRGVAAEVTYANEQGKPVRFVSPEGVLVDLQS